MTRTIGPLQVDFKVRLEFPSLGTRLCQKYVPIVDCALNAKYSSCIFHLLFLFFYVLFIKSCQGRPYVDLLRNKVFLGSRMLVGGRLQRRGKDPRLCERNGRCTSLVLKSLEKGK